MHADPQAALTGLLDFLGVAPVDADTAAEAVAASSFDNMREAEATGVYQERMMQPTNPADFRSYKTRKGIVGDHANVMDEATREYVETYIHEHLAAELGYGGGRPSPGG